MNDANTGGRWEVALHIRRSLANILVKEYQNQAKATSNRRVSNDSRASCSVRGSVIWQSLLLAEEY
ncbi:MAG: hypothetical protein WC819_03980 [Parcubacteria group bacterium]